MNFEEVIKHLNSGGAVIWVLVAVSGILWASISLRAYLLYFASKPFNAKKTRDNHYTESLPEKDFDVRDEQSKKILMLHAERKLADGKTIINCLVVIAPLLGLLGTVTGMIETFEGLGQMSLFSSDGGIAGGISKALLTTQLGLVIAVPGILLERILSKRAEFLLDSIDLNYYE